MVLVPDFKIPIGRKDNIKNSFERLLQLNNFKFCQICFTTTCGISPNANIMFKSQKVGRNGLWGKENVYH